MTNYPYLLFNQSPEQLRRIGARGGKAQARNRRAQLPPQTRAGIAPLTQTAAQASRVLEAQFPWLRGAEKRCAQRVGNQSSVASPSRERQQTRGLGPKAKPPASSGTLTHKRRLLRPKPTA
jgi:hypothetical protein